MNMSRLLEKLLKNVLMRPVTFDKNISAGYILKRAIRLSFDLVRGAVLVRKKIVLGAGARVLEPCRLFLGGGLVRIEEYCLVDCAATDGIHLGRNFKLGAHSRMIASGALSDLGIGIRIGDNVGIGEFAYIGGAGGVIIGADTIVGQYFSVHPENHNFEDQGRPIREQGVTRIGIEIGDSCWIGAKVTVTDGVKVGRHCVIAAGSVVTRSFPDYSVIGGVPARLIRPIGAKEEKPND